jgi:glycosyltransferase involved in cell wall biosynthesis
MVDLVDHGFNGLLVPPRDAAALFRSLGRLLESPALAREMGRAARATMASRFASERALEALDRIYSQLDVPRVRPGTGPAVARPVPLPPPFTAARRLQEN